MKWIADRPSRLARHAPAPGPRPANGRSHQAARPAALAGLGALVRRAHAAVLALLAAFALAGCAAIDPSEYSSEKPRLDLRSYFDGTIDAWGIFQDRSGRVVRRFTVVIRASWDGDLGTLDEDFTYSDGEREKRVWTIRRRDDGSYVGTADDVVGEATGVAAGNALNWRYTLALKVDDEVYQVDFDDWMFLVDEDVMLNRAVMSKFGIRLGEVFLSFRRRR
ncbi:MAG: DUF3833 domain-containing protein [Burkholderiales bacterium]|nr:MAG: DUF3833 domain-containing protein [Burkholderiales bacterium]